MKLAARERGCPLNALVAEIDVARLDASAAAESHLGDQAVAVRAELRIARMKAAPPSGAWSRNSDGSISSSSMILSAPSSSGTMSTRA